MYEVRIYFNNTLLPATPRHADWHARASIRSEDALFGGYRDGDHLVESAVLIMRALVPTPAAAAEMAFEILNRDDRPNGRTERSLSVGDIVRVSRGEDVRWLLCKSVGFEEIPDPTPTAEIEEHVGEWIVV